MLLQGRLVAVALVVVIVLVLASVLVAASLVVVHQKMRTNQRCIAPLSTAQPMPLMKRRTHTRRMPRSKVRQTFMAIHMEASTPAAVHPGHSPILDMTKAMRALPSEDSREASARFKQGTL